MSSPFWPLELLWLVHAQISRWRMNAALPWVSDPNSVPNPRYYRASSWAHSPGSSSLSKFGIFFFVLTLQWNPFIPHLAEDVKLFCQGSWMQGKLGWGFPCPELASTVCWSGLCCAVTMGVLIHHLEEPSVNGQTCNFRSQPAHDQLPCGHEDKPPSLWATLRMLLPPLCSWQCCSIHGSKASLSQGENYQCESLPWAKLAQHSCPPLLLSMGSLHCAPVPQPFPEQWSPCGQFSCSQTHAPMNSSSSAPTGQSWYFGSLGFLDHYCFVLMCCTMNGLFRFTCFTGLLGTGEVSFPESE